MAAELNKERTVAVDREYYWRPIDECPLGGVKVQLINRRYGVAVYGTHIGKDRFWTHWAPLPVFRKEKEHGRTEPDCGV